MHILRDTIWEAEDGKVFKSKITGETYSELILLAVSDSIDNYEEVDKPPEEPVEEPTE